MKKYFFCSLIHEGVLGGGMILDSDSLIYRTNKLTVDSKYRDLTLPRNEIKSINWRGMIAEITMKNGDFYRFLIFNKRRFIRNIKLK